MTATIALLSKISKELALYISSGVKGIFLFTTVNGLFLYVLGVVFVFRFASSCFILTQRSLPLFAAFCL